jgi:hypothetical protein
MVIQAKVFWKELRQCVHDTALLQWSQLDRFTAILKLDHKQPALCNGLSPRG